MKLFSRKSRTKQRSRRNRNRMVRLESLEHRVLLAGTTPDPVFGTFSVSGRSQFADGPALVIDEQGFFGAEFDTGLFRVGGIARNVHDPIFARYRFRR